ncbi:hypothetical protein HPB48_005445 [Haemaphysalis longicornis]|uniref:Uncharacterized protein n=1 Tax=Haemaphysalis longicornis TaxID=44386 RepID=A0A9J6GFC6_HAELO|nr:hypothetical protein HPB48_005445 [Haemaphysalis longicornis]
MSPQQEHRSETFLSYIKTRISDLKDDQRFVNAMVDEIHIKRTYFDYKGCNITGVALNQKEFKLQTVRSFSGYVVVEQLAMQTELLLMPVQRQVVTKLTRQLLVNEEQSADFDSSLGLHNAMTRYSKRTAMPKSLTYHKRPRLPNAQRAHLNPPVLLDPMATIPLSIRSRIHINLFLTIQIPPSTLVTV